MTRTQYYCASTSWSYDAGGWTNVAATIYEASSSDGSSLGQGVAYNWAGIYQNEDAGGWAIVSAHLCPKTVSCSTFFSTQALVGSDHFMWVIFAASAPGQVIPGSYQYGHF